jgi:restriction system protein
MPLKPGPARRIPGVSTILSARRQVRVFRQGDGVGEWAGWVLPILSVLVIGVPASLYLQRIRLPREETSAGVAALAGMRWRDFIHLVLDALLRRGYERVFEPSEPGDEGDYVLERGGQRFLLSSKHGAAYVLGSTAIAEFASAIRMRNLSGGLLVTPGQFAPEARPLARAQRIELLDGPTLWPELRPLMTQEQRDTIAAPSQARARQQVLAAWGSGLVMGALLFAVMHRGDMQSSAPAPSHPAAVASRHAKPAPAAVTRSMPRVSALPESSDSDAQLPMRRKEIANAIGALPLVDRAIWETPSTLLITLLDDSTDPLPAICPLITRYDDLAPTRLQLQPPAGSSKPVRFVQCRSY